MNTATLGTPGRTESPARPAAPGRAGWPWRTRLLVAAAVAWTLFDLLFLALTGRYWWWRAVELAPPPLFVAVPLLLALLAPLARPARGPVLVAAAGTLAIGVSLCGAGPAATPSPAPAGSIRVVSWNTEYWDDADDPTTFYSYLANQHADIYLLQEHVSWDDAAHEPVPTADHRAELARWFPGYQVVATGELLTMTRLPVVGTLALDSLPYLEQPEISAPTHFDDYYRNKTLRTDVRVGGKVMSFYNVHVPVQLDISMDPGKASFYHFMQQQNDRRQAMYAALVHDLDRNDQPRLVAGDMNATSLMGELRQLTNRLTDARPYSGEVYPVSWPASKPLWRLDWALTGGDVRVHDYDFVPSQGMSDHQAQLLTVSVP